MTIGALARLHGEFGWLPGGLGMQTDAYAFDFTCCETGGSATAIAGEVKKDRRALDRMIEQLHAFGRRTPLDVAPPAGAARNSYKKAIGIRAHWPKLFWALAPGGDGQAYRVLGEEATGRFELEAVDDAALRAPAP